MDTELKFKGSQNEWTIQGKNLIKSSNEQVASVNSMLDDYEANAKLIAAAPDLLEACIKMYNSIKPKKYGVPLLETDMSSVGQITMPDEESVIAMCRAIEKALIKR